MHVQSPTTLSEEEIDRRIARFREAAFANRTPADVVYAPPSDQCPWAGCGLRIQGVRFCLDEWMEPQRLEALYKAWWLGEGLIAACPRCGRPILFSPSHMRKAAGGEATANELPAQWMEHAHVVSREPIAPAS